MTHPQKMEIEVDYISDRTMPYLLRFVVNGLQERKIVCLGRLVGMVGMGDETQILSPVLYQECSSYELFDIGNPKKVCNDM